MWEKLLNLFKNEIPQDQISEEGNLSSEDPFSLEESPTTNIESIKSHAKGTYNGPARLIGFNYLKKHDQEEKIPKKFISLSKLLRGNYR